MEENQSQTAKPISDDQELAKVLAGVKQESNNLEFQETPVSPTTVTPTVNPVAPPVPEPVVEPTPPPTNEEKQADDTPPVAEVGELDGIKKDALSELRPLVDKLDLEPDEKFDTYLLLIRSTDDKNLIAPAHEAAKNIPDETKRAQALLDIIKEIDFLSHPQPPVA